MTNKLTDGDFVIGPRGVLETVDGTEELLQRARIRLQARRGRFSLDPELGSELYQVDLNQAAPEGIQARIREALAPLPQVRLTGLSRKTDPASGRIWIRAELDVREWGYAQNLPAGIRRITLEAVFTAGKVSRLCPELRQED